MAYLTDQELLDRFEYYTVEVEELLLAGEDFKTVGDDIPFGVHLNDETTLEVKYANKMLSNQTGFHSDEIREMGMSYFNEYLEPESFRVIAATLPKLYAQNKVHKPFSFVQHVKLKDDTDFSPLITFTKSTNLQEGLVVCLSLLPKDFGTMAPKMEQIISIDQFKLKKFKRFQQLTNREYEILKLLANGCSNPQIADRLFISRQTVETHRKHIKKKLGIGSHRDLIKYAFAFNLVEF